MSSDKPLPTAGVAPRSASTESSVKTGAAPGSAPEPARRWGRRDFGRWLSATAPWITWLVAAGLAIWFGQDLGFTRPAPAQAELREVSLAASSDALLLEVKVGPGNAVRAGEILALLDPKHLEHELAIALADLERLTLDVPARRLELQSGDRDITFALENRSEQAAVDLERLRSEQRTRQAALEQVQTQLTRQQDLVGRGLSSSRALDSLALKEASLSREVEESGSLIAAASQHARATRSRLLKAFKAAKGVDEQADRRIRPLQAAIVAQEERVASLQDRIASLVIKAPIDGVVSTVVLQPGDRAAMGATVLKVLRTETRRVVAWLDEGRARAVALGDRCMLRPRTLTGTRFGQVVALGPAVVETPVRFRALPNLPTFARPIYIDVDGAGVIPGEAFDATCPTKMTP